jgi:hypothetical protein
MEPLKLFAINSRDRRAVTRRETVEIHDLMLKHLAVPAPVDV